MYTHNYGGGLKLMEHSYIGNPLMNVVEKLLAYDGDWHKDRIVWAGDYAEEGKFLDPEESFSTENGELLGKEVNVYAYMSYAGTEITPGFLAVGQTYDQKHRNAARNARDESLNYICNWDQCQFVDLSKVKPISYEGMDAEYRIHPLSLLVSHGNGLGGGDFRGSDDDDCVGSWAGDRISMEWIVPNGFDELIPEFEEG